MGELGEVRRVQLSIVKSGSPRVRSVLAIAAVVALPLLPLPRNAVEAAPGAMPTAKAPVLKPCPDVPGARCGVLERPLDPRDPAAGMIGIGFELHKATNKSKPALGTIVAVEGGPGYGSTFSRDYYIELFSPLLDRRNLLLMDNRGTGTSEPINCALLQSYEGDYIENVKKCGIKLGATSDLYGTAFAADDLAALLDALQIGKIDLYGDSYGTFFGQTFAVRHPDRVRTMVLDAAYPVEDQDPWYRDLNRAMRDAFRTVCGRDAGCAALGGDPIARMAALANSLRAHPIVGRARDADGVLRDVTVDAGLLSYLAGVATYGPGVYRELDGAGRAWTEHGDPQPLLRIAAEQQYYGDAGPVEEFSEGLYISVICNDYPQLWDISAPLPARPSQYNASVRRLRATEPNAFAPFTIDDWLNSPWTEFRSCIKWPKPDPWVPPVDSPATYPNVPTLVLVGDLDSITSPEGSRIVADRFPNSTFVEVANNGHVTALVDYSRCASDIVIRFVSTRSAGDTSCAGEYQAIRAVEAFPVKLADVAPPAGTGTARQRRVASAVLSTVGDVFPRWLAMFGEEGVGLRGGTFTTTGLDDVSFKLDKLRWVGDVAVSGPIRWNRATGEITATARFSGAASGRLTISWNDHDHDAQAALSGKIGGTRVSMILPAP